MFGFTGVEIYKELVQMTVYDESAAPKPQKQQPVQPLVRLLERLRSQKAASDCDAPIVTNRLVESNACE
jgi:hypothetical protein